MTGYFFFFFCLSMVFSSSCILCHGLGLILLCGHVISIVWTQRTYQLMDIWVVCIFFYAVVNNAVLNIRVQVFVWT